MSSEIREDPLLQQSGTEAGRMDYVTVELCQLETNVNQVKFRRVQISFAYCIFFISCEEN